VVAAFLWRGERALVGFVPGLQKTSGRIYEPLLGRPYAVPASSGILADLFFGLACVQIASASCWAFSP